MGTITEIYDYFRLIFARIGDPHCPTCDIPIAKQSVSSIIDQVLKDYDRQKIMVLAPIIQGVKGEHKEVIKQLRKDGYLRARIDQEVKLLDEDIHLERYKIHHIEAVIDRVKVRSDIRDRLADSIETAGN